MKMGRRIGNKQKVEYPSNQYSLCQMDEMVLETKHTNNRQSWQNLYCLGIYHPWVAIDSQCLQFVQVGRETECKIRKMEK
jgi:hypothetical protein